MVQPDLTEGNDTDAQTDDGKNVMAITFRQPIATLKPCIVPNFGERDGQEPRVHDVDDPLPTVTSRRTGPLSTPVLIEPILQQLQDANVDPSRIVFVDGQPYLLDIRFRMLQNPELARAMGIEDDETEYEFVGNVTEVTKQIGNAVPAHLAAALVKAALGQEMNR